ncbi:MAG: dihydrofolate reductase [Alistipes senegalensis]|nr:dihydrofolate reductase [Oxalobacter formigenes]MCM1281785.1 dihydrofolate reductase [Alistipes senegalensis]
MATLSLIAAMAENRVIGKDGRMPWHIPGELKIFRQYTMGKVLVMGRKTHESIGRVLPGRTTVIVTRQKDYAADGAYVAHSLEEALALAKDLDKDGEIMIGGGGDLFAQTAARADFIYLSIIHQPFDGETFFPAWKTGMFREVFRQEIDAVIPYSFVKYARAG